VRRFERRNGYCITTYPSKVVVHGLEMAPPFQAG
jgi:hypothetical protein